MSLNINREVKDTYYRYKMPKLLTKTEGKGNGIKTVVTNISEIAKAIYRKPSYAIKYFGMELGTQTIIIESSERYIVNGNHDVSKLQDVLYNFINKFVLCLKCGNPETFLTIKKKSGNVLSKCKACGNTDILDMKHKITQYIFKNPPQTELEGADVNTDKEENSEHINKIEKNTIIVNNLENNNVDGFLMEEDGSKRNGLIADEPCNITSSHVRSQQDSFDIFFETLASQFRKGKLLTERHEVRKMVKQLKLKESCMMAIMEIIFVSPKTILGDIEKYKSLFHLFTRAQAPNKLSFQNYVIGGLMKLVEKFNLAPQACHLLQALYDHDIVEEETILQWYEKGPSKKYVSRELSKIILKTCAPMIEWLRNAESEDDENEEKEELSMNDTSRTGRRFNLIQGEEDAIDIDDL